MTDILDRGWRIAVLTETYSSSHLTSVSAVNMFTDWIAKLRERMRLHATLIVPTDATEGERAILREAGLETVPVSERYGFKGPSVYSLLDRPVVDWLRDAPIDLVFCHRMAQAPLLQFVLAPKQMGRWWRMLPKYVVPWITNTGENGANVHLRTPAGIALIRCLTEMGHCAVATAHDRAFVFQHYVEPRNRLRALESVGLVWAPVDTTPLAAQRDAWQAARATRRAAEGLTVLYGGAIRGIQQLPMMKVATQRAYAAGAKVKFLLCTQTDTPSKRESEWFETIGHADRATYVQTLPRGDVFYYGVDHVSTGLALVEAVASGLLPLIRPKPWIVDRIPRGYPLVGMEAEALTRALLLAADDYDRLWARWWPQWRDALRVQDAATSVELALPWLRSVCTTAQAAQTAMATSTQPVWTLLQEVLARQAWAEVPPMAEVRAAITAASRSQTFDTKYLDDQVLRGMVLAAGYGDTCTAATPTLAARPVAEEVSYG